MNGTSFRKMEPKKDACSKNRKETTESSLGHIMNEENEVGN